LSYSLAITEQINKIRQLLYEVEALGVGADSALGNSSSLPPIEMSVVIQEIVDDLQPLLTPYEPAFYWHLFRYSFAESGRPYARVSTRRLQSTVVKSSRGTGEISLQPVRDVLATLESLGAIRKEGDPNREGTLYRVMVPDEIEACREYRRNSTAKEEKPPLPSEAEADFYNIKANRLKVYERDSYKCHYCGKQLTRFTFTLDHVTPVTAGGTNALDNLVTACLTCNSRKHQRPVGDFLADQ
jgi:hypothetical protein